MQWNDIFMCQKNTKRNKNKARENVFQKWYANIIKETENLSQAGTHSRKF